MNRLGLPAVAISDSLGRFRLEGLAPGSVRLILSKPGFAEVNEAIEALGDATSVSTKLVPLRSVTVRVVDGSGVGVPGAEVSGYANHPQEGGLPIDAKTTRADGHAILDVPATATAVALSARAPGFAPARSLVDPRVEDRIDVPLAPGHCLLGRVVAEGGSPLEGAVVAAQPTSETEGDIGAARQTTDASGGFAICDVQAGAYRLIIRHRAHAPVVLHSVLIEAGRQRTRLGDVSLPSGASLDGTVRDDAARAVAGARVRVIAGAAIDEMVTTGDGRFQFAGLPHDRPISVLVLARGHSVHSAELRGPTSGYDITLGRSATIHGSVVEADTLQPIRSFRLHPHHVSSTPEASVQVGVSERLIVSDDGHFEWHGLPPGRWSLAASAAGFESAQIENVVLHGALPETVQFRLRRTGSSESQGRSADR